MAYYSGNLIPFSEFFSSCPLNGAVVRDMGFVTLEFSNTAQGMFSILVKELDKSMTASRDWKYDFYRIKPFISNSEKK